MHNLKACLAPIGFLAVFFAAAVLFRPLLPIDETRYLTVAWEMFLHKSYLVPSLNFQPYHHKPPMLFWLINIAWEIFGVSRTSALVPIFCGAAAVILLTRTLALRLFEGQKSLADLLPWIMLGSVTFLIYSTLMMFDMIVTAIALAILILFLDYLRTPKKRFIILAGLLMGAGVLTKGPVLYLYTLWPLVLYPLWKPTFSTISHRKFYESLGIALLVSLIPVAAWLGPALSHNDRNFAFWLVWNQTAGRVTGNFSSAHIRPFYFYVMLLPVLVLPWAFLPQAWKSMKIIDQNNPSFRFLAAATIPVFVSFSLIAGKQPHYMLPLLPYIVIAVSYLLAQSKPALIKSMAVSLMALVIIGQGIASKTNFPDYDLRPLGVVYNQYADHDWAFARKYQGELGFIARMKKPFAIVNMVELDGWFDQHPDGLALIPHKASEDLSKYKTVFDAPYKGAMMGVYAKK